MTVVFVFYLVRCQIAKSLMRTVIVIEFHIFIDGFLVTLIIYPNKKKLRGAYLAFRNYVIDAYKRASISDLILME